MSSKKSVVIVGAGYAGIALATALSAKLNASEYHIVLINPLPFAVPLPASLRLVVSEAAKLEETALVPLDRVFKKANGETRVGVVASIVPNDANSGGHVVLESGDHIPYEILVIASGSKWKGPTKLSSSRKRGFASYSRLAQQDKKVTIVQGGDQLLNSTYPASLRRGLASRLLARGVELLFNEYVDSFPEEGSVGLVTRKGTQIPDADLVISARGPSPNTAFVGSLGSSTLSEGWVHQSDVIEWREQKQAAKVASHAGVVVQNILKVLDGKSDGLANYGGSPEMIVITNGRNGGMCYFPFFGGFTLGDFWTRLLKSRGLMLGMFRSNLGY
ncbi:FAD/NAD(P)-binding domain-containing protein [Chiua virens]|nr:FAD/NAD(P)-binding domain-containing protein [Chiua virens]